MGGYTSREDGLMTAIRAHRRLVLLVGVASLATTPAPAEGQGCEPIRFTIPVSLGGEGEAYQPGKEWRLTVAYRRLLSNQWFIGTERNDALAPGGSSPVFEIHTGIVDLAY